MWCFRACKGGGGERVATGPVAHAGGPVAHDSAAGGSKPCDLSSSSPTGSAALKELDSANSQQKRAGYLEPQRNGSGTIPAGHAPPDVIAEAGSGGAGSGLGGAAQLSRTNSIDTTNSDASLPADSPIRQEPSGGKAAADDPLLSMLISKLGQEQRSGASLLTSKKSINANNTVMFVPRPCPGAGGSGRGAAAAQQVQQQQQQQQQQGQQAQQGELDSAGSTEGTGGSSGSRPLATRPALRTISSGAPGAAAAAANGGSAVVSPFSSVAEVGSGSSAGTGGGADMMGTANSGFSDLPPIPQGPSNDSMASNTLSGRATMGSSGTMRSVELAKVWTIPFRDLEIIKQIGEGSFGRVYMAKWCETLVAVKLLLNTGVNLDDMEAAAELAISLSNPILHNLQQEAALMAALRHPNIVGFLGVCPTPPCVVSDFCSRGSLNDVLKAAKDSPSKAAQLDWTRRINMALDAAKGMLYLHLHNPPILHRDLKSPNLLVDKHWKVKVSDFNLSKIMEDTASGSSMAANNPRWLAPEVLDGQRASLASDVYSYGVVLWELLTFQVPWGGRNQWQVMKMVTEGKRLQLPERSALPKASQGFIGLDAYEDLVRKCWAEDPAARPTFSEIIAHLRDLLGLALKQDAQRAQAPAGYPSGPWQPPAAAAQPPARAAAPAAQPRAAAPLPPPSSAQSAALPAGLNFAAAESEPPPALPARGGGSETQQRDKAGRVVRRVISA